MQRQTRKIPRRAETCKIYRCTEKMYIQDGKLWDSLFDRAKDIHPRWRIVSFSVWQSKRCNSKMANYEFQCVTERLHWRAENVLSPLSYLLGLICLYFNWCNSIEMLKLVACRRLQCTWEWRPLQKIWKHLKRSLFHSRTLHVSRPSTSQSDRWDQGRLAKESIVKKPLTLLFSALIGAVDVPIPCGRSEFSRRTLEFRKKCFHCSFPRA